MKKGDQRRQDILNASEELFYRKGYEGTSIQDVLDVLHFSKGGFYHHFESKLQLLEAICDQKVEEAVAYAEEELAKAHDDAVSKLNVLLSHIGLFNQKSTAFVALIVHVAYEGEGALLRDSLKRGYMTKILPLMKTTIDQGMQEGVFSSAYPGRLAEMLIHLGACITDEVGFTVAKNKNNPECALALLDILNSYRQSIEVLLNAPYGSVRMYELSKLITVLKEVDQSAERHDR